ncbi:MAG: hypothetical protein RLZZ596_2185 [Pseudomonadota bacterium]
MENRTSAEEIWQVGALCRAIAAAVDSRFNPVAVRGEISGFARAGSGHCYFALKDQEGQLRCAMFRRAASMLDFNPQDGELVEVQGRLGVYEPRGDLQLVVESMRRAGQGALFEQFLKLKAKLQAEGLFDPGRKRPLTLMPRGIGVVTSLGAAALHDVVSALGRRAPHVPVVLAPASVQGSGAPEELIRALANLYALAVDQHAPTPIDSILLVRGGGSMEDLWAFNNEDLARMVARSPVPLVSGVGHETDFTICDFVADLRAPTPTAAAELAVQSREVWRNTLLSLQERLGRAVHQLQDRLAQRLDTAASQLGRPSALMFRQRLRLQLLAQGLGRDTQQALHLNAQGLQKMGDRIRNALGLSQLLHQQQLARLALQLERADPAQILRRGYAWASNDAGHVVTDAARLSPGQSLQVHFSKGAAQVKVTRVNQALEGQEKDKEKDKEKGL